jgi:L-aspartate oxidase
VRERFPPIALMCRQVGIDIATDRIPVGPAAHYLMGGIETDAWGRSSLPGLFAAGEAACTGVHGANRLASNSLLEGLVFGARAADAMQRPSGGAPLREAAGWRVAEAPSPGARVPDSVDLEAVRAVMWRSAGLFRSREGLLDGLAWLDRAYAGARGAIGPDLADTLGWQRFNLLTVARLITHAALRREESRGGHFREDFAVRDDLHWKVHVADIDSSVRP